MADPWSAAASAGIGAVGSLAGGLLNMAAEQKRREEEMKMKALEVAGQSQVGAAGSQADRQAQALAQMLGVYQNILG
jgi:hypothetical protein